MAFLPLPRRSSIHRLLLVAWLALATVGVAFAHNGEPVPLRPYGGPSAKTPNDLKDIQTPPRWSWLHWWEANRDRFLAAPDQDAPLQPAEAEQLGALRTEAAGELL